MLENDAKNSYGAFSNMGKNTAKIFSNIKKKDLLLNPKSKAENKQSVIDFLKRNNYHTIEGDEEEDTKKNNNDDFDDSISDEIDEENDIFSPSYKNPKSKKKKQKKKKNKNSCYHRLNEEDFKFHDSHINKKKHEIERPVPTCTKYAPNTNLIWKRTITGPKWETMGKRKNIFKDDNTKYYLNHENPLNNAGHCFINMNKQTMRGDITNSYDLRIKSARPFSRNVHKNSNYNHLKIRSDTNYNINRKINNKWGGENIPPTFRTTSMKSANSIAKKKQSNKHLNLKITTTGNSANKNINTTSKSFNEESIFNSKEDDENNASSELNDSYQLYKHYYIKQLRPNTTANKKENSFNITTEIKTNINKSNESISSAKKSKKNINTKRPKTATKYTVKPIIHKQHIKGPEFDKIISRNYYDNLFQHSTALIPFSSPNVQLTRERSLNMVFYERPTYLKRLVKTMKGINLGDYMDDKNLFIRVPEFDKMKSRPSDNGSPLPIYMKGQVSRDSCNKITEMSLKMNNFANGKFYDGFNTFVPKKSFNKIVNLNLLNSKALFPYLLKNKSNNIEMKNYIEKSLRFYNKNYVDLMKEGSLTKFDNVTYKAIPNIHAVLPDYLIDSDSK